MDTKVTKSNVGARVVLATTVRHPAFAGLSGIVEKAIVSRNVYAVRVDDGRRYDLAPENAVFATP